MAFHTGCTDDQSDIKSVASYEGPLEEDDPASRFVQWIREGKIEIRGNGELWKLWEQRRGFLPEPKRAEREDKRGYRCIRAHDLTIGKTISTLSHRVIWVHFFGNIPPGMEVNHKNGFKNDNRLINLELVTPKENKRHAVEMGLCGAPRGMKNRRCVLSDKDIASIYLMRHVDHKSQKEIALVFGVRPNQISRVLTGNRRPLTFGIYQELALRTARTDMEFDKRLMVAALGLAGEVGEVTELIKKHIGHGHPMDKVALLKELSDVCWYLAEICNIMDVSFDDVAWMNTIKLRQRYPEGFSVFRSMNRSHDDT